MSHWSPDDALGMQRTVAARVERDRRRSTSAALPLGLFGLLSLVGAGLALTEDWTTLGIFWSIAGPLGGGCIGWWSRRQDLRLPFGGPTPAVMVSIAAGMVAGALILGWSGAGDLVFFAIGCGYLLFAVATGNRATFWVAVAILAAVWLSQVDEWAGASDLAPHTRTAGLMLAVAAAQLAGAAAEIRRVRMPTGDA